VEKSFWCGRKKKKHMCHTPKVEKDATKRGGRKTETGIHASEVGSVNCEISKDMVCIRKKGRKAYRGKGKRKKEEGGTEIQRRAEEV